MTSGVKQALPQMLSPKTTADGRMPRGRAGGQEFAATLGGVLGNPAADAKIARPGSDLRTIWSGFAQGRESDMPQRSAESAENRSHLLSVSEPDVDTLPEDTTETASAASDIISLDVAPWRGTPRERPGPHRETETNAAPEATPAPQQGMPQVPPSARAENASALIGQAHARSTTPDSAGGPSRPVPSRSTDEDMSGKDAAIRSPEERQRTSGFVPMGRAGQHEAIGFEPAASSTEANQSSSRADTLTDQSADRTTAIPRITVVGQQNVPAPMPSTALVLVDSIASSDLLEPTATKLSFDTLQPSTYVSAHSLKIQLHPAELGMVTATLRFAGDQLSIELKVENQEAYRQLSADSDLIVNSLRDLGYDVDRVTVLQPSSASTGTPRTDGSPVTSQQGRPAEQFGQGSASGGNGGSGGQPSGDGSNTGRGGRQNPASQQKENAGGVYI